MTCQTCHTITYTHKHWYDSSYNAAYMFAARLRRRQKDKPRVGVRSRKSIISTEPQLAEAEGETRQYHLFTAVPSCFTTSFSIVSLNSCTLSPAGVWFGASPVIGKGGTGAE